MTPQQLHEALARPFESDQISWRVGSGGMVLAYIDARDVLNRLNEVCTVAGWRNSYPIITAEKTICRIEIKIDGEWIGKENGAGDTQIEAEKGAISDAFKRAAVQWGIGQYLYDLPSPKVGLVNGRIPPEEYKKLADLHDQHCLKMGWGSRPGVTVYRFAKAIFSRFVTNPAEAQDVLAQLEPEIKGMPAAMQKHLTDLAQRIGANTEEAA